MRTSPVVRVVIDGESVTVDGVVLPAAAPGAAPYDAALRTLATSATRRRPVRAEITESFGVTRCEVLPDASTREVTFTYTGGETEEAAAADPATPARIPPPAASAARQVVRRQRPSWRSRLGTFSWPRVPRVPAAWVRPAALVAATALVVATAVGLVSVLTGPDGAAGDGGISAAAATAPATPRPTPTAGGRTFAPLPRLRVTATGALLSAEFRGDPGTIRLRLLGPVVRDERLRLTRRGVVITQLPPGEYHWRATALGHSKATGTVVVEAPPPVTTASSTSSPTPVTSTSAPPAPPPPPPTFAPPVDPDRN